MFEDTTVETPVEDTSAAEGTEDRTEAAVKAVEENLTEAMNPITGKPFGPGTITDVKKYFQQDSAHGDIAISEMKKLGESGRDDAPMVDDGKGGQRKATHADDLKKGIGDGSLTY